WTLEMIDAPFAWGCSTGSAAIPIGVLDAGFHAITDLLPNIEPGSGAYTFPADTEQHGTFTTSVLAAAGNNHMGMTGVMWSAKVMARDPAVDTSIKKDFKTFVPYEFGKHVVSLASAGVRVVNISWAVDFAKK